MPDGMPPMKLNPVVLLIVLALAGCPHPGPTPVGPPTPGPEPTFACDAGAPSDALMNDLVNAAQILDDTIAFAAIDAVAVGRLDATRCACAAILPDLRNAAVTGVHLAAWLANHGGTP